MLRVLPIHRVASHQRQAHPVNGTRVANFRLAVNQRVKQDDGTWRDGDASFFKVNAWHDLAENVAESLGKGNRAVVLGRLGHPGRPHEP